MTSEEAIRRLKEGAPFSALYVEEWEDALSMAIEALQERKTGKWIEKDAMYICTACKQRLSKLVAYDVGGIYNYCPFCGAKMEADQ